MEQESVGIDTSMGIFSQYLNFQSLICSGSHLICRLCSIIYKFIYTLSDTWITYNIQVFFILLFQTMMIWLHFNCSWLNNKKKLTFGLSYFCLSHVIFQLYIDLWATFPGANMVKVEKNTRVFTYPDILHTGKKVCIDHKMFDMFTSRNVKKIFKYPISRPTK